MRAALLVTGNEIRTAGALRAEAQIWDVNTPMLTGILTQPQIDIVAVEQGIDSRDGLFLQIAELAANADLVITTAEFRSVRKTTSNLRCQLLAGTFNLVALRSSRASRYPSVVFGAHGGWVCQAIPCQPSSPGSFSERRLSPD